MTASRERLRDGARVLTFVFERFGEHELANHAPAGSLRIPLARSWRLQCLGGFRGEGFRESHDAGAAQSHIYAGHRFAGPPLFRHSHEGNADSHPLLYSFFTYRYIPPQSPRPRIAALAALISVLVCAFFATFLSWAIDRTHYDLVYGVLGGLFGRPERLLARYGRRLSSGEVIFHKGDEGEDAFFLLEGEVDVWLDEGDGLSRRVIDLLSRRLKAANMRRESLGNGVD